MFWQKEKICEQSDYVPLKNGANVKVSKVNEVMRHLSDFIKEDASGFIEFVAQCRFPDEKILQSGNLPLQAIFRNLVYKNGDIPDEVRNIVLSGVQGIGINIHLVSPIAENGYLYTYKPT